MVSAILAEGDWGRLARAVVIIFVLGCGIGLWIIIAMLSAAYRRAEAQKSRRDADKNNPPSAHQ